MKNDFWRTWKLLLLAGIGIFVIIVLLAIGITAKFSFQNIKTDPYDFISRFFSQWSPALSAAGTLIAATLAGTSIYWSVMEARHSREKEDKELVRSLWNEVLWNSDEVALKIEVLGNLENEATANQKDITNLQRYLAKPLETRAFESLRNSARLRLLGEAQERTYSLYRLITWYNRVVILSGYSPMTMLKEIDECLKELRERLKSEPEYLRHTASTSVNSS